MTVNELLLDFRIKNGFYGTNKYECKEILNFIWSESEDLTDDGKKRKIIDPSDISEIMFDIRKELSAIKNS